MIYHSNVLSKVRILFQLLLPLNYYALSTNESNIVLSHKWILQTNKRSETFETGSHFFFIENQTQLTERSFSCKICKRKRISKKELSRFLLKFDKLFWHSSFINSMFSHTKRTFILIEKELFISGIFAKI